MSAKKVTDDEIRQIEKQGLTLARSASVLGIHRITLARRAARMKLPWRGKGVSFMEYCDEQGNNNAISQTARDC